MFKQKFIAADRIVICLDSKGNYDNVFYRCEAVSWAEPYCHDVGFYDSKRSVGFLEVFTGSTICSGGVLT